MTTLRPPEPPRPRSTLRSGRLVALVLSAVLPVAGLITLVVDFRVQSDYDIHRQSWAPDFPLMAAGSVLCVLGPCALIIFALLPTLARADARRRGRHIVLFVVAAVILGAVLVAAIMVGCFLIQVLNACNVNGC